MWIIERDDVECTMDRILKLAWFNNKDSDEPGAI
jgi:hypothetical protein